MSRSLFSVSKGQRHNLAISRPLDIVEDDERAIHASNGAVIKARVQVVVSEAELRVGKEMGEERVRNNLERVNGRYVGNSRCCCINACSADCSIRASARLRNACRDHVG